VVDSALLDIGGCSNFGNSRSNSYVSRASQAGLSRSCTNPPFCQSAFRRHCPGAYLCECHDLVHSTGSARARSRGKRRMARLLWRSSARSVLVWALGCSDSSYSWRHWCCLPAMRGHLALVLRRGCGLTSRSSGRVQQQRPASPGRHGAAPLNSRSVSPRCNSLDPSPFLFLFAGITCRFGNACGSVASATSSTQRPRA